MREAAYGVGSSTVICIRLFGPLEVSRRTLDGNWRVIKKEEWTQGTPPRSVLKRLLTTPDRRLSRIDIEDDLWSETSAELATQNLSNALMVLRRVIGKGLVETSGPLCGIAYQSQVWTDLDACSLLLKDAENHGCTTAEALPFLEEIHGYLERGKCLEDESGTWCYAVRADAERLQRQCRIWLAEGYERTGKLWQAGEMYCRMTRTIPPDEEALHSWMQMLIRHGKPRDAVQCYQDYQHFCEYHGFLLSPVITTFAGQLQEQTTLTCLPPAPSFQGIISEGIDYIGGQDMHVMLRRQMLQKMLGVFSLSQVLSFTPLALQRSTASIEDYLSQCEENICACWRLMRGSEIAVVQSALCMWLPSLEQIMRDSTIYQQRSAVLAVQGYIIAGLVTVLRKDYESAEWCCKQAIEYSELAEDPNLKVAALKHLATKYNSAKYSLKTLHTYQEALPFVEAASPLLRSRIYLGLALSYAQCGKKSEAFQYWDLTQRSFPDKPENDPGFLYADCGRSSLNHYGGLMYLAFGQADRAWQIFEEVVQMKQQMVIPERTIVEIVNCKAEAAIAQKNLDLACTHLQEGIQGAIRLRSEKRFHDSLSLYKQACTLWPREQPLLELEELFH